MKLDFDKNLFIRICEFGINHPDGFSIENLCISLNISKDTWEYDAIEIQAHSSLYSGRTDWNHSSFNPELNSLFQVIKFIEPTTKNVIIFKNDIVLPSSDISNYIFILRHTTVFNYLDFKEYKAASKNSTIATVIAVISILITFWFQCNQETKLDKEQFKLLYSKIDSNRISSTNSILLLDSVLKTTINDHIRIHKTKSVIK